MSARFNFAHALLDWFDHAGRKDLPWQQTPTPYAVWVSEIMLQQTQVATVKSYFLRFMARFPTIANLAEAPVDDVLAYWSGLGYYARARNLHKTANIVMSDHDGNMPKDLQSLVALPGIGRSTAGAILSMAFHQPTSILDGNVKRVIARFYALEGWPGKKQIENQMWNIVDGLLPDQRVADYIQAQMDLGATVCTRSKPDCEQCPMNEACQAYASGTPTAYPTPKPKKVTPNKVIKWLVYVNQNNEIWLEKRPDKGIWGGLWSFPEVEDEQDLHVVQLNYPFQCESHQKAEEIQHIFTHFKLRITPLIIRCQAHQDHAHQQGQWYTILQSLALGLPAPVRAFINSME